MGLPMLAKQLKVDTSQQGFLKFRLQDIEWVTVGVGVDRSIPRNPANKHRPPTDVENKPMHRIAFGDPVVRNGLAVRLAGVPPSVAIRLRRGPRKGPRIRGGGRGSTRSPERSSGSGASSPCFFLPDDRTIVFAEEDAIRKIASDNDPAPPTYLSGKAWERASRGSSPSRSRIVTIHSRSTTTWAGRMTRWSCRYSKGPTVNLRRDDADPIVLHADASCRDRDASQAISRSIDSLIKLGRQYTNMI